jgi:hypothetical protein
MVKETRIFALKANNIKFNFCCYNVQIGLIMSQQTQSDHLIQKWYKMHCSVRLHGQDACYVIFWNIAPKHWIYMDRGYCNSFYFYLWLSNYWEYVIAHVFAVEWHILLKIWLILRIKKNHHVPVCPLQIENMVISLLDLFQSYNFFLVTFDSFS